MIVFRTGVNIFASCARGIYQGCSFLCRKIQEVWRKFVEAWNESSREVPPLLMPHPLRPDRSEIKKKNWPGYLDCAMGRPWAPGDALAGTEIQAEPREQVTALHAVAKGKNYRGVLRLIANGADVNARDVRGQTPAYWAAYFGNLRVLMMLANYGADLNRKDVRNKSPLRAAVKYDRLDVIDFLVSHRVDLDPVDERGMTPLHLAAYKGKIRSYQKLVMYGADVTKKDSLGRTAEEVLQMKYAEIYHNSFVLSRMFMSRTPPAMSMAPYNVQRLVARRV